MPRSATKTGPLTPLAAAGGEECGMAQAGISMIPRNRPDMPTTGSSLRMSVRKRRAAVL